MLAAVVVALANKVDIQVIQQGVLVVAAQGLLDQQVFRELLELLIQEVVVAVL
jgi:hypothetical protein